MRLIDADALLEAMNLLYIANTSDRARIEKLIENIPTVQREGWVSVPIEPTEEMIQAATPAETLQAHDDEVLEQVAVHLNENFYGDAADEVRALKGK